MPLSLRIATFNCENLFQRAKVLNLQNEEQSSGYLQKITVLQTLLDSKEYDVPSENKSSISPAN